MSENTGKGKGATTGKGKTRKARGPLGEAEKANMQEARTRTREERKAAKEVLTTNPQFTNEKFWAGVDLDILTGVSAAIEKAQSKARKARVAELEAELARIKGE